MTLAVAPNPSLAGETDALTDLLKQIDKQVCTSPKKLMNYYDKEMVIIADDKRILPENRIKDYEVMIAELQGMIAEMRGIARPKAAFRIGYVEARTDNSVTINGLTFNSRVLQVNLAEAHRVFFYLATCGTELEEWSRNLEGSASPVCRPV